jgi:hypothetical protein
MFLENTTCTYPVVPVDQEVPHPDVVNPPTDLHMLCDACCSSTRDRAAYNIDDGDDEEKTRLQHTTSRSSIESNTESPWHDGLLLGVRGILQQVLGRAQGEETSTL